MNCVNCAHFKFHLKGNINIGLCSHWVESVDAVSSCDSYTRYIGTASHDPLSINGKTYPHFIALNRGYDWGTGLPLSFRTICAIAANYKIDISLLEQFKNRNLTNKRKLNLKVKRVAIHRPVKRFKSVDAVKMLIIDELYKSHELHSTGFISDTTHNVLYSTLSELKTHIQRL
ncbi:hypothetical protein Phi18:4_gp12 [Cellulophaga phage phi18:4]|nr:hypothetical protein Phi18:4_gp12 [Cellulophaga phage phi18:4]AGO49412.1 hypothetical protein Phi48:1_gp12 [Cellulophaga phage phi48:1]